jgi:hypothetical protein
LLDTLKTILSNLVKCGGPLIKMAVKLDKTMEIAGDGEPVLIAEILRKALPYDVLKREASKTGISVIFVKSWVLISGIITNSTLGRETTHQLHAYLSLMGRLESTAEHAITEANEVDVNSKLIKLTGQDLHQTMLGD